MENPIAILIMLAIAGAWAAYLLPSIFGSRRNAPLHSTEEFNRLTARLASVRGVPVEPAPVVRRRVLARRRRILVALVLSAVVTLVGAIWQGSTYLLISHIAIDAIAAWYVAMLVQIRQRRAAAPVVDLQGPEDETGERHLRVVASR